LIFIKEEKFQTAFDFPGFLPAEIKENQTRARSARLIDIEEKASDGL
jgi:hypothetical protein